MSESPFASLPRFDDAHYGSSALEEAATHEISAPPPQLALPSEEPVATKPELDPNVALLMKRLSDEVAAANERVLHQTKQWVIAIAEKLFPELSKACLADEIARQLPELLPEGGNRMEIKAGEALAEDLQNILQQSDRISSVCTIVPQRNMSGQTVEVSWVTGGLEMDFDGLLAACVSRVQAVQLSKEDS
ncbi:hypothetical protein [Hyphomonas pacifica]|uniref:hypothetical protein n=1 Tax=Hyphomonas pacifica TaxID=1280941 RepID=UPI000DBF660B|nr:hypothetical protein [Hyphomonas pacifica]RAN37527.1 hypothetical protein HY11_08555 [Hyphomonas pacifica]